MRICNELTMHTRSRRNFYPELRAASDDYDLLDEAEVEHATAKDLIAQIEAASPADAKFAAKVIVLGEYVNHHIKEEEREMFPQAKKTSIDMNEAGRADDGAQAGTQRGNGSGCGENMQSPRAGTDGPAQSRRPRVVAIVCGNAAAPVTSTPRRCAATI